MKLQERAGRWALPVLLLACLSLTGCDLNDVLNLIKPEAQQVKPPSSETSGESKSVNMMSPGQKLSFYRWLVKEMEEQIFARPLIEGTDISGWANVLTQRGSIEGVYHGIVFSTDYGTLEQMKKAADIKALRFYGLEMALMDSPYSRESDDNVQTSAAKYVQDHMTDNIYTLKRVLGERILKEAGKHKGDDEKLAAWYSGIAARWAKLDIPFGLAQRNNKDEAFHFNWAKENTLGMLEWELLNREHRILNQFGGIAFTPAPQAAPAQPQGPLPKSANPAGM